MYLVCQIEDIAERRASGEALAHQAVHDPLTGLPNRLLFVERLGRELTRRASAASGSRCSSSTSTASRSSTTASATRPATGCWSRWPTG